MSADRRSMTTLLALTVIGLLHFLYVVDPFLKGFRQRDERIAAKEVRILRDEQLIAHGDDYRRVYASLEPAIAAKRSMDEESTSFLKSLESAAKSSNLLLTEIRPIPSGAAEGAEDYSISLSTEGSLESIALFLHGLVESLDLVEVRRLAVAQRSAAQGGLKAEFEIAKRMFRA